MVKTVGEIAELVSAEVTGDRGVKIKGVAGIREARPGDITFLADQRYLRALEETKASAVVVSRDISSLPVRQTGAATNLLMVDNPYLAFAKILELFKKESWLPAGVSPKARVGKGVSLGAQVSIFPFVYIGDNAVIGDRVILYPGVFIGDRSMLGEDSIIYPNVTIREDVIIGKRVIIHSGSVIGSDGFGFVTHKGKHHKIPQIGGVIIGDDVEIGANVAIDRATMGNTIIKRGTKMDNLVHIAHNVVVGEDVLLLGQVGISGSTEIGNNVVLGGQVGVVGHVKIGDRVKVGAKSGVSKDIKPDEIVSGIPAITHGNWLKAQSCFAKLPELRKSVNSMEKKITELERRVGLKKKKAVKRV